MTPAERSDAIEIEGRRFAWRSIGNGPVLVLLNGYSASPQDWDPNLLTELALRTPTRVEQLILLATDECGPRSVLAQQQAISEFHAGDPPSPDPDTAPPVLVPVGTAFVERAD